LLVRRSRRHFSNVRAAAVNEGANAVILNACLLAVRGAQAIGSDRDLEATVQFSLLGLALSFALLHFAGPEVLVDAALIE